MKSVGRRFALGGGCCFTCEEKMDASFAGFIKRTPSPPTPNGARTSTLLAALGWQIAAELCVYTNNNFTVHSLDVEEDENEA